MRCLAGTPARRASLADEDGLDGHIKKPAQGGFLMEMTEPSAHVQTTVQREVCAGGVAALI